MGESAGVRKREVQTKETRIRRIEKDTYTYKENGIYQRSRKRWTKTIERRKKERGRRKIKGERDGRGTQGEAGGDSNAD